ncbi:hypothetical protein L195_g031860 [Trifolium pratense]|uniref:Uncharacterized protein n=1 Tax=Trifolium pratense TaxID=57577 RepID=A0A2K3LBK8_TRIPR|nr:hypothetical protein L195_g031860 [Trifolium pratense]
MWRRRVESWTSKWVRGTHSLINLVGPIKENVGKSLYASIIRFYNFAKLQTKIKQSKASVPISGATKPLLPRPKTRYSAHFTSAATPWADSVTSIFVASRRTAIAVVVAAIDNRALVGMRKSTCHRVTRSRISRRRRPVRSKVVLPSWVDREVLFQASQYGTT